MRGRALVAWNLRRIRVNRGLSQKKLAFDAGIDRSYVSGLERQEENPTVDLLDRLAGDRVRRRIDVESECRDLVAPRVDVRVHRRTIREIGRASCRERV